MIYILFIYEQYFEFVVFSVVFVRGARNTSMYVDEVAMLLRQLRWDERTCLPSKMNRVHTR